MSGDICIPQRPTALPPRNERKPKRIRVRVTKGYRRQRVLTYHIYGKRPKRGDKVRIKAGIFAGRLGTVSWRWSCFRGTTYLVKHAFPTEWS